MRCPFLELALGVFSSFLTSTRGDFQLNQGRGRSGASAFPHREIAGFIFRLVLGLYKRSRARVQNLSNSDRMTSHLSLNCSTPPPPPPPDYSEKRPRVCLKTDVSLCLHSFGAASMRNTVINDK